MNTFRILVLIFAMVTTTLHATAQNYDLTWFTIGGGGGSSSGGSYSLDGTIGQPDAGMLSGGDYTLEGGFWNHAANWSGEPAPRLSIDLVVGTIRVSWPLPTTGYHLEWATSLESSSAWTAASLPYATSATHISRSEPLTQAERYYRLRK